MCDKVDLERTLQNKEEMASIIQRAIKNPEILAGAQDFINTDPVAWDVMSTVKNSPEIAKVVGNLSLKEKKKILAQRTAINSTVARVKGERYVTCIYTNGKVAKMLVTEDFPDSSKSTIPIGSVFMAYSLETKFGVNKVAMSLLKKATNTDTRVYGPAFIYSLDKDCVVGKEQLLQL